jgi:uncharacterized membrane protein (DUF4010 family)
MAGWMWSLGDQALAALLLAGGVALVAIAYFAICRRDVEGTTEVAALVTLGAAALAGLGFLPIASGMTAITILVLVEKKRLHATVARIDDEEIRAATRFAVMAAVILPLLPEGPFGPLGGIRPRLLWLLVLFFSGLSFVAYLARKTIGAKQGSALAGVLGGLISSTNVAFSFSRQSAERPELAGPLAFGILAACAVLFVRVLVATTVLNSDLVTALLPYVAGPFVVGIIVALLRLKSMRNAKNAPEPPGNPLQLRSALQMAGVFQLVLFVVHGAQSLWGSSGVLVSAALVGLTDLDAITISMARQAKESAMVHLAAQAITLAILSNTLVKAAIAAILGRGAVRIAVPIGLAITAVALVLSLALLH